MATKANKVDPQRAILEQMKAKIEAYAEAHGFTDFDRAVVMADFREIVSQVSERWDGKTPLIFAVWSEGASALLLGAADSDLNQVRKVKRQVDVLIDMARAGEVYECTFRMGLSQVPLSELAETAHDYYRDKTRLASCGC